MLCFCMFLEYWLIVYAVFLQVFGVLAVGHGAPAELLDGVPRGGADADAATRNCCHWVRQVSRQI